MTNHLGLAVLWCTGLGLVGCSDPQPAPRAPVPDPASASATTTPTPAPSETATSSPALVVPQRLQALGTEPFWSVDIDGRQLRYSTPEDQAGQTFTAERKDSANAATWAGEVAGKRFVLGISPHKCSDGMSDTEYPYEASLTIGDRHNRGCARLPR